MQLHRSTYHTRRSLYIIVITVVVSFVIVAITLGFAMWNKGYFLPSWAKWDTYAIEADINGNTHMEKVELMNRHLAISDDEGNLHYTPNDWLIADFAVTDIIRDGTPEIFALVWKQDADNGKYSSPFLGDTMGFSQYLYVFDYESGCILPIWFSEPLDLEATAIDYVAPGRIEITLSNNKKTYWVWNDNGFILYDRDFGTEPRAYID